MANLECWKRKHVSYIFPNAGVYRIPRLKIGHGREDRLPTLSKWWHDISEVQSHLEVVWIGFIVGGE